MCTPDDMADPEKMMQNCVVNVCQPGSGLLAAGYCLYSSSVIFMLSIGNGCHGFTYDSLVGEFILTHPDLKVTTLAGNCPSQTVGMVHPSLSTKSKSQRSLSLLAIKLGSMQSLCYRSKKFSSRPKQVRL